MVSNLGLGGPMFISVMGLHYEDGAPLRIAWLSSACSPLPSMSTFTKNAETLQTSWQAAKLARPTAAAAAGAVWRAARVRPFDGVGGFGFRAKGRVCGLC